MNQIKILLWDLDGTINDFLAMENYAIKKGFDRMNPWKMHRRNGKPLFSDKCFLLGKTRKMRNEKGSNPCRPF